MIDDIHEDVISINLRMIDSDYENFRKYIKE